MIKWTAIWTMGFNYEHFHFVIKPSIKLLGLYLFIYLFIQFLWNSYHIIFIQVFIFFLAQISV